MFEVALLFSLILLGYCVGWTVIQLQQRRRSRQVEAVLRRLNQWQPQAQPGFQQDLRHRLLSQLPSKPRSGSGPGTRSSTNSTATPGPWPEPSPPSSAKAASTSSPGIAAAAQEAYFRTSMAIPAWTIHGWPSTGDTSSGSMAEAASGSTGDSGEDAAPDGDPRGRVTSIPCDGGDAS